ncbi:2-C-methyl-D-erythritol 4-phosphate cytidylyltransferase [Saccharopolyspora erythraea NRRL 2338]|uniref:2-C-methyl-D-erythritol 4-phosphate cytidylyltransferase n=2 Tax=Saccharopolyspora erythraea TaxID=1836 RepID=ISPD_SACEN|nr:2-C-methyl-D-erythritol 4-phosphate cytidylyltransferase [Saccharopolyspora erythraea]A4F6W3.1 RecName: Full=2-C-methyl-D-erythritol 4-phosphate cytidylyltransferase; AltName: Full=4-diphosphocytidyl-2C-methyl-D-erythritol synthase; AltName: Full=MEP cytidylyltransferase; Short=MCT [Saccharopolyspora erythraea NRRL 2338]EQD85447.1 2-C-methyl-D-erythritol 4-phosphate cytidylyltransferase [Saccharopolyspora erythraea D]PFG93589.1 2-C-methyl-D-erythritol 4-phosphate cytidylyltransferase [Sacchar
MSVVALVPAAGRGVRLGAGVPKALVPVAGESLLSRAVRGLHDSGRVRHVVVAAPADEVPAVEAELASLRSFVHVVPGGAERTDSVRLALAEAERVVPDARVVLVHDAARAFTPPSVVRDVVRAVEEGAPAVVPVLPVADTIKQVDEAGDVETTVDRSRLRTVQTPQGFAIDVLRQAYAAAGDIATDDAGLVERIGGKVSTVPGHPHALKITTAFDLAIAEAVLA